MAASPNPLVWTASREIGNDINAKTGGLVHFYDEQAQTIFLNGGMKSRYCSPKGGQWETTEWSFPSEHINEETGWNRLNLDHPVNGILFGAVLDGTQLKFLRYRYAADLSQLADTVTWNSQIDNPVTQMTAAIINASAEFFTADSSLVQPGGRLALGVKMGDSEVYPIGVVYLDDTNYKRTAKTVPLSGRNAIGYYLKDSKIGPETAYSGTYPEVIGALMTNAGVPQWETQYGEGSITYDHIKPMDTFLETIQWVNDIAYYSITDPMVLAELPDGTVISAWRSIVSKRLPNGYYTFNDGSDVFARETKKNADAVYAGVYATGKDFDGKDLVPVVKPIANYRFWNVPPNKLIELKSPEGWVATQPDLEWWALDAAKKRQYTGITESFESPFRPQLLVGDVAEVIRDGAGVTLGVITQVKHTMGRKGFSTFFTCDSGGEIITTEDGLAVLVSGEYGYNRKQNIGDLVRKISAAGKG